MAILHIPHPEGKQEYQGIIRVTLDEVMVGGGYYAKIFQHEDIVEAWKSAMAYCLTECPVIMFSSDVDDFLMSGNKYRYDEETGLIYERSSEV